MFNYNKKTFRSVNNTINGDVNNETFFHFSQDGKIVRATYSGGDVECGHLIAIADENGVLDMRYHHVNKDGGLMTGVCRSVPQLLGNGKIRLHENWQWTSGDRSVGTSIIEEI